MLSKGIRGRCIKKVKKLTSVSFAFTHTYTLEKLTLLLFFPKRTWKMLNCYFFFYFFYAPSPKLETTFHGKKISVWSADQGIANLVRNV